MVTPAGMVFGVVLEPGERVVYYHRDEPGWQKPFLIILGILMLIGFIGIFILIAGLMATTLKPNDLLAWTSLSQMYVSNKQIAEAEDAKGKARILSLGGKVVKE